MTRVAADYFYFAAGGSTATKDFEWIANAIHAANLDCSLNDVSNQYSMISVQGPFSRELLQAHPPHMCTDVCLDVCIDMCIVT